MKDKRQKFIITENEDETFDIIHLNGGWSTTVTRNNPDALDAILTAERLARGARLDESHVVTEFRQEEKR